jgi:PAS domain S-box-containing protein
LAQVCRYTGWAFGHAFLPAADDPDVLIPANASYEHAPGRFKTIRTRTLALRIPRGTGLVGRVYASGQPEWTRGIDREPDANRAELGEDLGIETVAAFPILVETEVVGVLEFFSDVVADPPAELLDAMTSIGTQLGRVIERERMDRALRESYRLLDKIAETSPSMIRIFDEEQQRYVHVNERMAGFFGSTADEAMQAGFEHIPAAVHPDDLERYRQAKAALREPGRESPVTWQVRIRNAVGEWRWVRTWSVVFTRADDGAPKQTLSMSIDVTDEVQVEEKLRQTERLTSLGTLAAGIAHEVNNPLASVVMTAQLVRRKQLDAETDEMLDNLIQDAKRCGRIVRSVQKFARQEPTERVPLDVNAVVRAAEELSRTELKHSGIKLRLELETVLPPVTGDPTELEQVVLNLITNAANASAEGQEVVVRTRAEDGCVRVSVHDDGHGMSPEVKRHLFDPFFTTRGREGGTGLGLSIAHGIVEDHGGEIGIDSEVGHGTTMTVSLPAADAAS